MIKKQAIMAFALSVFIVLALFIDVSSANSQISYTIQSNGIIKQQKLSPNYTAILRGLSISTFTPPTDIDGFVDNFVETHPGINVIEIDDMHQYGIWWYGYTFSKNNGTWMGWSFEQIQTLINRFHYWGWKVVLGGTGVAWNNQEEYNYITTQHPELAFTTSAGALATGIVTLNGPFKLPEWTSTTWKQESTVISAFASNSTGQTLFGYPTIATQGSFSDDPDCPVACRFTLSQDGTVSSISVACCSENSSGDPAVAGIYTDNFGSPGTLLGTTQTALIYDNNHNAQWVNFTFAMPINLSAGNYWISLMTKTSTVFTVWDSHEGTVATGPYLPVSTINPGFNKVIPDPFALFATPDITNNITAGTRLIDLYTTRLTYMIKDGLSFDAWFGTDGWNGYSVQGYHFPPYSFSIQEENEYANWSGSNGYLPSNWANLNQTEFASVVTSNSTISANWAYYWQIRFAQMYAQINQAFIDAGKPEDVFHTIGSADGSSLTQGGGNLSPAGMYNMSIFAEYNSLSYIYVDQEGVSWNQQTKCIGPQSAFVGGIVKMQSTNLKPIIGLQAKYLTDYPLWEVKQQYLSEAVNYVWINGTRYRVSDPNVFMLQYAFSNWTQQQTFNFFNFINSTSALLQDATPIWLGPTYVIPSTYTNFAFLSIRYSVGQWVWGDQFVYNPSMGTILSDSTLPWSGNPSNINNQMYIANKCPIESSEPLVDLKVLRGNNGDIIVPITNQRDVNNNSFTINPISTTLTINATELGLFYPIQEYSAYWQSNPNMHIPLTSDGSVTITLYDGADILVISPSIKS